MKITILIMIISVLTLTPVSAQDDTRMGNNIFYASEAEIDYFGAYSYEILHQPLYATQQEVPEAVTEVPAEWEDIGSVSDLILTHDWKVKALQVDVGGFLGLFPHTVAIDVDSVKVVAVGEELTDNTFGELKNHISLAHHGVEVIEFFLVIQTTREELNNAPEFKGRGW